VATRDEKDDFKEVTSALSPEEFARLDLLKRIRTIEFFTLDETTVRLRKADWLDYVCFTPTVTEDLKQQNCILSGKENVLDSLLKSALEFTDVNDTMSVARIIEEAVSSHVKKVEECQKKIKEGKDPCKAIDGREWQTTGLNESLINATEPERAKGGPKSVSEVEVNKKVAEAPNLDQLKPILLKSYYSLRLLKTRDVKIKLIHAVNYFRAIQRIIAFEMKSYVTRERAQCDFGDLIEPQFGKNEDGLPLSATHGANGPGKIFINTASRELDTRELNAEKDNPVTLKAYKYRNKFSSQVSSTCPLMSKHHRTFGRPSLYEQVS